MDRLSIMQTALRAAQDIPDLGIGCSEMVARPALALSPVLYREDGLRVCGDPPFAGRKGCGLSNARERAQL
ncbi:hypothetical protein GEU84_011585 [Fertoebacter nigrum]|uniref:Uncharacterized protein n=1 Tax=Fertoeibacter niger TaxID=2656921 RepID=A0A8X8H7U9_9RHOB|nr:hypothetical protein [Fertoeibacter niger]NUB45031.1 hypothetical protein [Fertoeibacter niger]